MIRSTQVMLNTSNILNVPFQFYQKDFSFVVNKQIFKTNRIISDILSPNVCKIHLTDPSLDEFVFKTNNNGDFSRIFDLLKQETIQIPENELPFFLEVIEILGYDSFKFISSSCDIEITKENIFDLILYDSQHKFLPNRFSEEIDFISSHFNELCETRQEDFMKLHINTLLDILKNPKLQINSEDQLLKFVIDLYSKDLNYSILFETVYFVNVSSDIIQEFISIYDFTDMTFETWKNLSSRLIEELNENHKEMKRNGQYKEVKKKIFPKPNDNSLTGIINYLREKSDGNIENEIKVFSNTCYESSDSCQPISIVLYDDGKRNFRSLNKPGNWICIDFQKHKIIPTNYAIQSRDWTKNCGHPKNWVIEGSNDNSSWIILDERKNCDKLNGSNITWVFPINNKNGNEFKYMRMRLIGKSWADTDTLSFKSIEFFGELI